MKKILVFTVLASAFFSGCSNEETSSSQPSNKELNISTSLLSSVSSRSLVTAFDNTSKIGVCLKGEGYTTKAAEYSYNGTTWESPSATTDKLYLSNKEASVYAYSPSNATLDVDAMTIDVNVSVNESSFDASAQADYLYATSRAGSAGSYTYPVATASNATNKNKVDLYMHHALSKLSFVINKGVSYTGDGKVTKIELDKMDGFWSGGGKLILSDGTFSGFTAASNLAFSNVAGVSANAYSATTPSTTVTALGLAAPITDVTGITMKLTIDGKEMSVALPALGDAAKWMAGNNYTYTLTVLGTNLVVNSVTIVDWTPIAGGAADVQ